MRTLASTTRNTEKAPAHRFSRDNSRGVPERDNTAPVHFISAHMIQRKASCACGGGCPNCQSRLPIQAKLKIGQPNDKYEQEADRIADEVMRMPDPAVQRQVEEEEEEELLQTNPVADQVTTLVQRQVESEEEELEEEEVVQTKPAADSMLQRREEEPEEEEEEILQTKEVPGQTPEVSPDLQSRIQSLKGGGQPLPESVRAFFEPRFGYDFSQVRVHTNTRAVETARALNARAFTVGRDIVFGAGQYAPENREGENLLAHELTHVVQQQSHAISRKTTLVRMISPTIFIAKAPKSKSEIRKFFVNIKGKKVEELITAYINPELPFTSRQRRRLRFEINRRLRKKTDKDLQYYKEKIVGESEFSDSSFAQKLYSIIDEVLAQRQSFRKIFAGEQPLKLVLYDTEAGVQSRFFQFQANMIARSINAVKVPSPCPKDKSKLALEVGGMGFKNLNILPLLKRAKRCVERNIDEVHVVGHTHDGVVFSRAKRMAKFFSPKVRMIFHGCSVLDYRVGLKTLLKHFGSEAEIYVHATSQEAGRPYEFYKVTLPEQESAIKTELLKKVTIILPKTYIRSWAEMQKSERLYGLLKEKEKTVQKESKEVFIEILSERLRVKIRKWSRKRLERALKKTPHDWEKKIIEQEIKWRDLAKSIQGLIEAGGRLIKAGQETIEEHFGVRP